MMHVISKGDPFFDGEVYKSNRALFCGLDKIIETPGSIIKVNENNTYLFVQLNETSPIWIWTQETTDQSLCDAISKSFYANYAHQESMTLVARPQVGAYIATYFSKMKNLGWHVGLKFEGFEISKDMLMYPCAEKLFRLNALDDETMSHMVQSVPPENRSQIFKRLYASDSTSTIGADEIYAYMVDGYVRGALTLDTSFSDYAKIGDIFLLKSVRGKRIGREIIFDACQMAQKKKRKPLLFTERMGGYTRMLFSDPNFQALGSLDEIVIYK